jgi:hypothetical protein
MPNYFESNRDKLFFVRRAGKFDHEIGRRGCIGVYVGGRVRASETATSFHVISICYIQRDAEVDRFPELAVVVRRSPAGSSARQPSLSLLSQAKNCRKLR